MLTKPVENVIAKKVLHELFDLKLKNHKNLQKKIFFNMSSKFEKKRVYHFFSVDNSFFFFNSFCFLIRILITLQDCIRHLLLVPET